MSQKSSLVLVVVVALCGLVQAAPVEQENNETYDTCIKKAANYLASIKIDEQVQSMVDEAREHYDLENELDYSEPDLPGSCQEFKDNVEAIAKEVPCYADDSIMGTDAQKANLDLIKQNGQVKKVIEANYACVSPLAAGHLLHYFQLLDAIKN